MQGHIYKQTWLSDPLVKVYLVAWWFVIWKGQKVKLLVLDVEKMG